MIIGAFFNVFSMSGADWPHYRGPTHDGASPERILKQWPAGGPRRIWKQSMDGGFSSFSISQGRAYTSVNRSIGGEIQEVVLALDADTGNEIWARPLGPPPPRGITEEDGPRSTPAVDGARVYVLSVYLVLTCLNTSDGSLVWKRDLIEEFGGHGPDFEAGASPLLHGDLVLVNGPIDGNGSKLLGIDKHDGHMVWTGPSAKLTHSTPVATTILGVRQVLFYTGGGVVSIVPETGQELWRYSFNVSTPVTSSPVLGDGILYHSAGYGIGARAARISKSEDNFSVTELWHKRGQLINFLNTPVYYQGHVYGMYGDKKYGSGPLECYELANGEKKWSQPNFGVGQVLLVDHHLLALSDTGTLVLVKPDPQQYTEVARFKALNGKCWNSPAISHGRIYARSTREAICLDVSLPPPPRVRLSWPVRQANGRIRITMANLDGSPIDSNRLVNIELRASPNLARPVSDWSRLGSIAWLVEGKLVVEEESSSEPESACYYLMSERP